MKVLLYLEGKSVLQKSGIGRALQHQMHALDLMDSVYDRYLRLCDGAYHSMAHGVSFGLRSKASKESHHAWPFNP